MDRAKWGAIVLLWAGGLAAAPSSALPPGSGQARGTFADGVKVFKSGDYPTAQKLFAEARELAPDWALPHLYWALRETAGDPTSDAGLAALERARRLAPDNPRINYVLGQALARRERWPEAATAFAQALALRPGIRDASFQLGRAMDAQQRYADALAAYRVALEDDPNHAGALASLAVLFERFDRFEEAESALLRIARLQPHVAYHRYRLAQFYERIGEPQKAKRARQKAEQIDPQERDMRPLRPSRR